MYRMLFTVRRIRSLLFAFRVPTSTSHTHMPLAAPPLLRGSTRLTNPTAMRRQSSRASIGNFGVGRRTNSRVRSRQALLLVAAAATTRGVAATEFDLAQLSTSVDDDGAIYYAYEARKISPWQDIPYSVSLDEQKGSGKLLSFVCEIPRGTSEKVEIHKSLPHNPLKQDVHTDGSLRSYVYSASLVNYGAIAQTWEDPEANDEYTGLGGDNDPIDVLQLNEAPCRRGDVQRVRVLGALALIDGGETDWKLLVIDVDAPDAPAWYDVADVPTERVDELREWFRVYKTAEGKPENDYGLSGVAVNASVALWVAEMTHEHWLALLDQSTTSFCVFEKQPCWLGLERDKQEL